MEKPSTVTAWSAATTRQNRVPCTQDTGDSAGPLLPSAITKFAGSVCSAQLPLDNAACAGTAVPTEAASAATNVSAPAMRAPAFGALRNLIRSCLPPRPSCLRWQHGLPRNVTQVTDPRFTAGVHQKRPPVRPTEQPKSFAGLGHARALRAVSALNKYGMILFSARGW
jgi:hypothetical protein